MSLKNFCAAPWVEGVLRAKGQFLTCCRNATVFGNWQQDGLLKVWHAQSYQQFRQTILDGEFPDEQCQRCYHNGTSRPLQSELLAPFDTYLQIILEYFQAQNKHQAMQRLSELPSIKSLWTLTSLSNDAQHLLQEYVTTLQEFMQHTSLPVEIRNAITKLHIIGNITHSFLAGELTPQHVAPFRQVHLISKCNAQCIQCPGRYTGEIFNGPELDEASIPTAFSYADDMIDFFMNGSDFLFYKSWKTIADILTQHGVKLSISTNSILLTPANIRYLIDHRIMHKLNISMDGATKGTVEAIRINVNFDTLLHNMRFLFEYASECQYDFSLSISFVLMQRNYHEFPDLLRLLHELKNGYAYPQKIHVFCQSLETYNIPGYMQFYQTDHHALVSRDALIKTFDEVLTLSQTYKNMMNVGVFYTSNIEEFVAQDYPFPPMVSQSQKESSLPKILFGIQGNAQRYQQDGWSLPEIGHTWTSGRSATLVIPDLKSQNGIVLHFAVHPLIMPAKLEQQRINVVVNDHALDTVSIENAGEYAVTIGADCCRHDNGLKITFELPDATSPKELGINSDERILALAFQSIWLTCA